MHTIKFAARLTGLSPHTIRAWERRYHALTPDRTATNRRLYSTEDMDKLSLLHRAVRKGHSIGQIAHLTIPELQSLVGQNDPSPERSPLVEGLPEQTEQFALYMEECLRALKQLDAAALEHCLTRASSLLGAAVLAEQVILPLLTQIGEAWHQGEVQIAQEHMASAVLRTFLGRTLTSFQPPAPAPRLIVATPARQIHELGALTAAVTAASEGWRVLYLGPNLPAEEIARAALQTEARAVALSLVHPPDDPELEHDLTNLRLHLTSEIVLLVGGGAAWAYKSTLDRVGAIFLENMDTLRKELDALRAV